MSIVPIPGFGPGSLPPTRENLAALRSMNALPVRAFASGQDFYVQGGEKQASPDDGPAKYWNNPYAAGATKYVFLKRDKDTGAYIARKLERDVRKFPVHLNGFLSPTALSFFDSRPHVMVPDLEIVEYDAAETRRLSFPYFELDDPIDYPIGWVSDNPAGGYITSFPGDNILFMEDGVPYVCHVEDAQKKWPVQWGPHPVEPTVPAPTTAPGVTDEQFVATVRKAIGSSAFRQQALIVVNSPSKTDAGKRAELLKL